MLQNRRKRLMVVCAVIVALYCVFCTTLAYYYVHPSRRTRPLPQGFSAVFIPTRYGPTPAWCLKGDTQKPVFLFAHGYGGSRKSWVGLMTQLNQRGFGTVAVSMPGHESSPVNQVGFGILEAHVVVDSERWLRSAHPGQKVVLVGVSLGGAAAWLATLEDPDIDGLVTESAFANLQEPMESFFNSKVPGGSILFWPVIRTAQAFARVDPSKIQPIEAAAAWKGKPALVIQAEDDKLVAPSHGVRLSSAAGCPIWMVPGAEHANVFAADPDGYVNHLVEFANRL